MAILHRADLSPTKLELLADWLPTRPWYDGPSTPTVERVAAYRFDDPAGEVGVETLLVTAGTGTVWQTPLTYRAAPLDGRDEWLLGTTEHSVLGTRWVYDACGDPVYAQVLATAILTGAGQAEEFVVGSPVPRPPSMTVAGSGDSSAAPTVERIGRVVDGDPTVIVTGAVELTVARVLRPDAAPGGGPVLTGGWDDRAPVTLASARPA
ncbi:CG0192-related protein [Longispora urticae]